jgi:hypothetical protein
VPREDEQRLWQEIRALRAAPVRLAAEDEDRAAVFSAALRQAQELAESAAATGYATMPLPLFYALSQGVRALAAAGQEDDAWRIRGHGASVRPGPRLMQASITPKPSCSPRHRDSFSAIHAMMGTDPVTERMVLADLWRATPSTPALPPDHDGAWAPLQLRTPVYDEIRNRAESEGRLELAVTGLSLDLDNDSVADALAHYPSLAEGRSVRDTISPQWESYYVSDAPQVAHRGDAKRLDLTALRPWIKSSPVLTWRLTDAGGDAYSATLDAVAPVKVDGRDDHRIVFPAIGGSRAPGYLALWWAVLLALSSLVRYEPALWTAAIDPDCSRLAVPLEQICDYATGFIPRTLTTFLTENVG